MADEPNIWKKLEFEVDLKKGEAVEVEVEEKEEQP